MVDANFTSIQYGVKDGRSWILEKMEGFRSGRRRKALLK